MKFIVSSSALLKQLQQISGVINANTVLPILEDFLFEVEKNKLTVVATDLETVMRCLERWYDVEVKYEAKPDIHYTGQIARNQPLSKVIHMLEQTGQARFRLVTAGQGHQAKDMIIILE